MAKQSSQIKNNRLLITNSDLTDGKFKKDSVAIIPKNFTLHKSILGKYIGKVNKNILDKVFSKFCLEIGCKDE